MNSNIDGPVKSPAIMSFRAKREIFRLQRDKKIRFLPAVEMTNSPGTTFYEFVNIVDCISFEIVRSLGLEAVFAFDSHFRAYGFRMMP